jgi:hypothetical protein
MSQQRVVFLTSVFVVKVIFCFGQDDSTGNKVDSFLMHQKGLLGTLARNIMSNKTVSQSTPVRTDLLFSRYKGKIIRNVAIKRLDFGTPITDTSQSFKSTLTKLANDFHHKTREQVIRNNLFFKKGDILVPYLMADNERHLRDLAYLHDASIKIVAVGEDSVDILVLTKDVLSIGGSFRMHSTDRMSITLSEDNLAGTGHKFLVRTFFDNERDPRFAYGAEYTARNIQGSFIDCYGGFLSFNKNFNTGLNDDQMIYAGFVRPLVHPYMKFTYSGAVTWHTTDNVYKSDSLYEMNNRYKYFNYDAWIGWNIGALKFSTDRSKDDRLRTLVGLRYIQQHFTETPLKYQDLYNYRYANLQAILGSVTIFRQDFYKAQYVYGLGRNEDIPEGADISLTTGWTKKSNLERPYIGLDVERYYFTSRESYFNYTLKAGGFYRDKGMEDINLLLSLDYFSRLLRLGKWKQRNFVTVAVAHQSDRILNEPLFLQSDFGLREWRSDTSLAGNTRITLKVEPVFFTPLNLANFRFAPFVFGNLCLFTPTTEKFSHSEWFNSIGGGIKSHNESLIFGTMELRVFYFPQKNFFGNYWRLEFNSNIRFKYNRQFEKKPDLVNVNFM